MLQQVALTVSRGSRSSAVWPAVAACAAATSHRRRWPAQHLLQSRAANLMHAHNCYVHSHCLRFLSRLLCLFCSGAFKHALGAPVSTAKVVLRFARLFGRLPSYL